MEILTNKSLRSSTSSISLSTHYHFSQSFESSIRRKNNISFHVKHLIVPLAVLTRLNYNKKGKGRKKKFWEKSLRNIYKKQQQQQQNRMKNVATRVKKLIKRKTFLAKNFIERKIQRLHDPSFLSFPFSFKFFQITFQTNSN